MNPANNECQQVLVVDDEAAELKTVERILRSGGVENTVCLQKTSEVMPMMQNGNVGVILLDLAMPGLSGEELLSKLLEEHPATPVIIFTGFNDVETAVRCMRAGAFDYMVKPVENSRMISAVRRALELQELRAENVQLRERLLRDELQHPDAFRSIVTQSAAMRAIFGYIETVAKSPQPVLITGETGTGKELIARAIHDLSQRPGPFVAVNAAGLDDALFSDTLFGHTKGAFTSARAARKGLVEQAAEGTLFLDEIGDLSTASQVRLLRLAQEREYYPIGSDLAKRSRTRLVLATNRELESMQENGTFRKDLYFRLQTHKVNLPPLRDRLEDLPLLVDHFLEKSAREMGRKKPTPPRELFDLLNVYHYPGNIRELEGLVWEAVGGHRGGVLNTDVFRAHIERHTRRTDAPAQREAPRQIAFPQQLPTLQEMRRLLVEEALKRANGNQAIAAQLLGITRTALNKWLKRHQEEED